MIDGLILLMLTTFFPLVLYWGISYFFVCKEIVTNIAELIGWRG